MNSAGTLRDTTVNRHRSPMHSETFLNVSFCIGKAVECRRNAEHGRNAHKEAWLRIEALWYYLARSYANSAFVEATLATGAGTCWFTRALPLGR
jgi:hypothetical protein